MTARMRSFLLLQAVMFTAAALVHSGLALHGYEHAQARTAESVIAAVLVAGLILTWIVPKRTRIIGLVVQAFALLGAMVGLFTVAVGVGPQTGPDIVYHLAMVAVLVWGLVVTARAGR